MKEYAWSPNELGLFPMQQKTLHEIAEEGRRLSEQREKENAAAALDAANVKIERLERGP